MPPGIATLSRETEPSRTFKILVIRATRDDLLQSPNQILDVQRLIFSCWESKMIIDY
jgi:hypothetical protein